MSRDCRCRSSSSLSRLGLSRSSFPCGCNTILFRFLLRSYLMGRMEREGGGKPRRMRSFRAHLLRLIAFHSTPVPFPSFLPFLPFSFHQFKSQSGIAEILPREISHLICHSHRIFREIELWNSFVFIFVPFVTISQEPDNSTHCALAALSLGRGASQ